MTPYRIINGFAVTTSDASERLCPNCGATFGPQYCGSCGQAADRKDRVVDIVREWVATTSSADGILLSTLCKLVRSPGSLTLDWWAHRRVGIMSPVRTLMTVVLFGSILAWIQGHIFAGTGGSIGLIISAFAYQLAIVGSIVVVTLLPKLQPRPLRRSTYEYTTFALYESAYLALVAWFLLAILVIGTVLPLPGNSALSQLAPLVLPLVVLAIASHAVWHMKVAFEMSWLGALVRAIMLGIVVFFTSFVVSFILLTSGISERWNPTMVSDDGAALPTFQTSQPKS